MSCALIVTEVLFFVKSAGGQTQQCLSGLKSIHLAWLFLSLCSNSLNIPKKVQKFFLRQKKRVYAGLQQKTRLKKLQIF
jgi:hypothetical protein